MINLKNSNIMDSKSNETKLTFIDLFAGIGGFHLAVKEVIKNSKCVFVSEIDEKCIEVYQENFNWKETIQDIKKVQPNDIPNHDFLFAGFPCQSFSNAGKKKGFLDTIRGNLFFDIVEIIKAKQPKYFLLENVKHLVKHNQGKTWQTIQKAIKELGYITTKEPLILNPTSFGVPQDRPRVYIPAIRKDLVEKINYLDIQKPPYLVDTLNGSRQYKSKRKQNSILKRNCFNIIERERANIFLDKRSIHQFSML